MSAAGDRLLERFGAAADEIASAAGEAAWVAELRGAAAGHLEALGWPHRKLEAWRHTSLAPLERIDWAAPIAAEAAHTTSPPLPPLLLDEDSADRVVILDGRFVRRGSERSAGTIGSVAEARRGGAAEPLLRDVVGRVADAKADAFVALGTALLDDGALIEIPSGQDRERPVHVVLARSDEGRLACPRLGIVARAGSRATVVVEHVTAAGGPHFTDLVAEVVVEQNARFDLVIVQHEDDRSFLVSHLASRQARDARLAVHTVTLGGRLVRNGLGATLADEGAEVDLRGLFVGDGSRHVDNHTLADHAMPHTTSRELYKGLLGGSSHGVFCGRVIVRPDAQKADSRQSNPNLLLTRRAEIDTQPQLEIYADDVKCSHGSTIGRLDEEALFYLRSRGIGADDARLLLTRGFANEIVDALPEHASVRQRTAALVEAALQRAISEAEGEGR